MALPKSERSLPDSSELDQSINNEIDVEAAIRSVLKRNVILLGAAKSLLGGAGGVLGNLGVPFAGTAADLAKIMIDVAVKEG